jgi:hypothetical protein
MLPNSLLVSQKFHCQVQRFLRRMSTALNLLTILLHKQIPIYYDDIIC